MTGNKPSFSDKPADPTMSEVECSKTKKQASGSRRSSSHHEKSHESRAVSSAPVAESSRRGKRAPDYCFPVRMVGRPKCNMDFEWQRNEYVRDECGSGILTTGACPDKRRIWCKTPLSMYQATIGEMGRKIICNEVKLVKELFPEPPCNISEDIMPPCRGYYRKYDCIKSCEEGMATQKDGKKIYRSAIERYWDPCDSHREDSDDIRKNAAHNAYLSRLMRRRDQSCNQQPCW